MTNPVSIRTSSPVEQGQTIAGKYQVEKVLGEGGMGLVVAAWHLGLQQRVAIKFLLAEIADEHQGSSERFKREARAAARIRSEHVCRVLDVGALESGIPFMVMEYLEGCDLAEELSRQGRLPIPAAIEYVLQACEALAEAHAAGIVHRDLKPANLYLAKRADGSRAIKVLDFGVSKSLNDTGDSHMSLTKTSTLVGSPIYMSPEQLESSKDVDARTDIWALGTILYQLLVGRTPFEGDNIPQLVNAVLYGEPRAPAALGVSIPQGLEDVVMHALAKNRDERYTTVADLAQALEQFGPPEAALSVTRITRVLGPTQRGDATRGGLPKSRPVSQSGTRRTQNPENEEGGTNKRLIWGGIAALLVIVALCIWLAGRGGETPQVHAAVEPKSGAAAAIDTTLGKMPSAPAADMPSAASKTETQLEAAQAAAAQAPTDTAAAAQPSAAADAPSTTPLQDNGKPTQAALANPRPTSAHGSEPGSEHGSDATSKHRHDPSASAPSSAHPAAPDLSDFGGRR